MSTMTVGAERVVEQNRQEEVREAEKKQEEARAVEQKRQAGEEVRKVLEMAEKLMAEEQMPSSN
jgi:hypothetical protein